MSSKFTKLLNRNISLKVLIFLLIGCLVLCIGYIYFLLFSPSPLSNQYHYPNETYYKNGAGLGCEGELSRCKNEVEIRTNDSVDKILAYYKLDLESKGWKIVYGGGPDTKPIPPNKVLRFIKNISGVNYAIELHYDPTIHNGPNQIGIFIIEDN